MNYQNASNPDVQTSRYHILAAQAREEGDSNMADYYEQERDRWEQERKPNPPRRF